MVGSGLANGHAYDPRRPLLSVHVPKCAGTSFQRVLRRWYGRRLCLHYCDERRARLPRRHRLERRLGGGYRPGLCIHGHFNRDRGFGVEDYYPALDQRILVLRDPFEAHVSLFHYRKREGPKAWYGGTVDPVAVDPAWTLERFLEERPAQYLNFLPADLGEANLASVLDRDFLYVGVAEDLQATVDQLASLLGLPGQRVPVLNAAPRTQRVPPGARERFEREHPLEYAAWRYARERYARPLPAPVDADLAVGVDAAAAQGRLELEA